MHHPLSRTCARNAALVALFTIAALIARPAHAQIVFNNGTPDGRLGYISDRSESRFLAETFRFDTSLTFNTVIWYGEYVGTNTLTTPDDFTLQFFNTVNGTPNTLPRPGATFAVGNDATRTLADLSPGQFSIYVYEYVLPAPLTLSAGTYGIGIENNTTNDPDDNWAWSISGSTGNFYLRFSTTGGFLSSTPAGFSDELSFALFNASPTAAPEPGTLALALPLVAVGIAVIRRRYSHSAV